MGAKTANQIDVEAARWAARVDRGPLSAEDQASFEAWLGGDERRLGAYGRVRAVSLHSFRAKALGPQFDPETFGALPAGGLGRRRFLLGGGAIAASLAGLGVATIVSLNQGLRFTTRKGEVRVVPLADGTVVTLNTASKIAVHFTSGERGIQLLAGEALFDVAKDKSRPFVVSARTTEVRAIGTSFSVTALENAPVSVLVNEGVVEVTRRDDQSPVPLRASANTRVLADMDRPLVTASVVTEPELHRELAWRDGRIAFEGEPLSQAVQEFARYSDIKIVVEDPDMGREEIAGLFQADDPVGFAQAIATSLDGHAVVSDGEVRITR